MNTPIVYIGQQRICFSVEGELFTKNLGKASMIYKPNATESLVDVFDFFVGQNKFNELYFVASNPQKLFLQFCKSFKLIEAAGGLIQHGKTKKVLMIYRWDKWDLPKGKLEKNEAIRNAAIRECEEECAVSGLKIKSAIAPTFHMYQLKEKWVLKKTHWFKMETLHKEKLQPQIEEGITKVEWLNASQIKKALKNTYQNIVPVIQSLS